MEVTSRFEGLDLVESVHVELWTEIHKLVQHSLFNCICFNWNHHPYIYSGQELGFILNHPFSLIAHHY